MKILPSLVALGLPVVTSSATIQAQETVPAKPIQTLKAETIQLKFVPVHIMAWRLDPQHYKSPLEIAGWPKEREPCIEPLHRKVVNPPLPKGVNRIIAISYRNALLVFGDSEGRRQLRETIALFDKPLRQVEIEARFIHIAPEDVEELGFKLKNVSWGEGTLANTDKVNTALRTLRAQGKAQVLATSRVWASDNSLTPFPIEILSTVKSSLHEPNKTLTPFVLNETHHGTSALAAIPSPPTRVQLLEVMPVINADDSVALGFQFKQEMPRYGSPSPSPTPKYWSLWNALMDVDHNETIAVAPQRMLGKQVVMGPTTLLLLTAHVAPVPKQ